MTRKINMKVKIAGSYYKLHDYNKEHNEGEPYCICCIQYIKEVMKKHKTPISC